MEEMNEFETKPRGTFWRDWGVYGALALCLAIIGAAVALTSLFGIVLKRYDPGL